MSKLRQPFRYQNNGSVYWLIGINALIFIAMYFLGLQQLTYYLSMIPGLVLRGWVWTFVTYMFVHGGFSHILFNMLALFIFGIQVERYIGTREFLLFYFVTGTLAGIFSFFVYYFTGTFAVVLMGASGAIFAVQLAYAVFFPNAIIYLWGILPLRAPVMVLGFTALELFSTIFGLNQGVAHLTHLAGFGFAWLYFVVRFGVNPWRRLRSR
jgi:membrane associated rhomboid family serine protease